jgi:hypothetical protein
MGWKNRRIITLRWQLCQAPGHNRGEDMISMLNLSLRPDESQIKSAEERERRGLEEHVPAIRKQLHRYVIDVPGHGDCSEA